MPDPNTTFAEVSFPVITESSQLADLFRLMCKHRSLTIARYDSHEPIRRIFAVDSIDDIARSLIDTKTLYWIGIDHIASGAIDLRKGLGKQTAWLSVWTNVDKLESASILSELLMDVASRFGATYGYMHYISDPEIRNGNIGDTVKGNASNPSMMVMTRWKLVRCLPDLYWANIFGPEYVELFGGRERVLSTPAPTIKELAPNTFYIQLSNDILDFVNRYDEIDALRERVKEHLGRDCFFDYETKFGGVYRVPNLGWKEPSRPPLTPEALMKSFGR